MVVLQDVNTYCGSEKVKEYANYCIDKINQGEYTEAFVYSSRNGMQFEDENDIRYIELNLEQKEGYVDMRIYINCFQDDLHNTIRFKDINKCIKKWNELF